MTDEQMWLLCFGRGWVNWWELADDSGDDISPLVERMHEAQMLEKDAKRMRVRLKTKEENEPIRI